MIIKRNKQEDRTTKEDSKCERKRFFLIVLWLNRWRKSDESVFLKLNALPLRSAGILIFVTSVDHDLTKILLPQSLIFMYCLIAEVIHCQSLSFYRNEIEQVVFQLCPVLFM